MGELIHLQKPFQLKSRSRDLGHVPFEVFHLPLCSTCLDLSGKEKLDYAQTVNCFKTKLDRFWSQKALFSWSSVIRAKVMEVSHYFKKQIT